MRAVIECSSCDELLRCPREHEIIVWQGQLSATANDTEQR